MTGNEPWEWRDRLPTEWLPEDLSITINADSVEKQMERVRGFQEMLQLYQAAIREITTKLETLDAEFRVRYAHNPIHNILGRLKSPQSMMEKLRRKELPLTLEAAQENLLDIAGVRVICSYVEDVYRIAELMEGQQDVTLVRRTDYIQNPKENGYRSLHIIVRIPVFLSDKAVDVPVEIQIRTIAMDFWASLEHELRYKASADVAEDLKDRLKACARTCEDLDREMQSIRNECIGKEAQ